MGATQGVAILTAAIIFGVGAYQARLWMWRNFQYAPLVLRVGVGVALVALVVSGFLGAKPVILIFVTLALFVVAAFWGRARYGQSPGLQRWDKTWAAVGKLLPDSRAEADRLVAEALGEDDNERERLRVRAQTDPDAARVFLGETERELSSLEASSARHPSLASVLAERRARLEADRAWVRTIIGTGAA